MLRSTASLFLYYVLYAIYWVANLPVGIIQCFMTCWKINMFRNNNFKIICHFPVDWMKNECFWLLPVWVILSFCLISKISMCCFSHNNIDSRLVTLITFLAILTILSRTCVPWCLKLMISLSSQVRIDSFNSKCRVDTL